MVFASPEVTGFAQRTTIASPAAIGGLVEALPPGRAGASTMARRSTVEFFGGEAASVSRLQLLNGANAVAIRSAIGVWEILQFESAEEIAPDIWRLSGLLRGQLGTDDADAGGAPPAPPSCCWTSAFAAAGLAAGRGRPGAELACRAGRCRTLGTNFTDTPRPEACAPGCRCRRCICAASRLGAAAWRSSWMRRGRIDADSWTPSDIPLGEEREEYRIDIAPAGGAVVRSATVPNPPSSTQRGHRRRFRRPAGRDRRDGAAAQRRRRLGRPGKRRVALS